MPKKKRVGRLNIAIQRSIGTTGACIGKFAAARMQKWNRSGCGRWKVKKKEKRMFLQKSLQTRVIWCKKKKGQEEDKKFKT